MDWTNVDADLSGEFEDKLVDTRDREQMDPVANEKVLVSVRVKPAGPEKDGQAWVMCATPNRYVLINN